MRRSLTLCRKGTVKAAVIAKKQARRAAIDDAEDVVLLRKPRETPSTPEKSAWTLRQTGVSAFPPVLRSLPANATVSEAALYGFWAATRFLGDQLLTASQFVELAERSVVDTGYAMLQRPATKREFVTAVEQMLSVSLVHHVSLAGVVCVPVLPATAGFLPDRSALEAQIAALDEALGLSASNPLAMLWRRVCARRRDFGPSPRRMLTEHVLIGTPQPPTASPEHIWHAIFNERLQCPAPAHRIEAMASTLDFARYAGGADFETRLRHDCVAPMKTSPAAEAAWDRLSLLRPISTSRRRCVFLDPKLLAPFRRPVPVVELAPSVYFGAAPDVFQRVVGDVFNELQQNGSAPVTLAQLGLHCGWCYEYGAEWGAELLRRYIGATRSGLVVRADGTVSRDLEAAPSFGASPR